MTLLLPCNEFYRWRAPGNNGEHFISTTRDLLLRFERPPELDAPSIQDKTLTMFSPDQQNQAGGADANQFEETKGHNTRGVSQFSN